MQLDYDLGAGVIRHQNALLDDLATVSVVPELKLRSYHSGTVSRTEHSNGLDATLHALSPRCASLLI